MERILIIGCSGSGKSTLARRLGQLTGIPVVHLDQIWWRGNWENISKEEFDTRLAREMEKPRWILDGNYDRTLPQRLQKCDTVIYLDFPRWLCLWGACKRVIRYHGQTRPDMGGSCRERLDWEFFQWIWNFNREHREKLYALLEAAAGVSVVILRNRRQVGTFVGKLEENHEA